MTGVIVRSAANVQAGGRTRLATVFHGAWLLLFVSFLPFILRLIPTASLGAVLVYTGYKLMNLAVIKELKQHGSGEVAIYAATVVGIVATNLLTGVFFGLALAVGKLLYSTQTLQTAFSHDPHSRQLTLELSGVATFLSLPRLAQALERTPPLAAIHLRIDELWHIDHACLNLLASWQKLHETGGGQAFIPWERLRSLSDAQVRSTVLEEPPRQKAG